MLPRFEKIVLPFNRSGLQARSNTIGHFLHKGFAMIEIDENNLYYFTALSEEKYHTLFVSRLRLDLVKAFEEVDGESSRASISLSIGENRFISDIGAPVYLLNC